jgi:tryptophan synthase alpha chain
LIGLYLVGGYPNLATFKRTYKYLQSLDIDFLEVGIPFNDPVADGPIIAKAAYKVIESGINYREILDVVCSEKTKPTYIMTYANILYKAGLKEFSFQNKVALNGVIVADLPNRMHKFFYEGDFDLDIIPFATPVSRLEDFERIKDLRGNFIYFISTTGVTGSQMKGFEPLKEKVEALREIVGNKKICVGFGIKEKGDIVEAKKLFDGAIIGTEIVKRQDNIIFLEKYLKEIVT